MRRSLGPLLSFYKSRSHCGAHAWEAWEAASVGAATPKRLALSPVIPRRRAAFVRADL